jgi:hypothetical protein
MSQERRRCAPFSGHVLDFDPSKANLETCLLWILDCRILFLILHHLLVRDTGRLADNVLKENDSPFVLAHP